MTAPTHHWKLGLFVVVGFVLTLATVAWLGARSLQKEVVRYVSYFDESVQGLDIGSPIKFRGVTIGTVGAIDIAPDHRMVEVVSELDVAALAHLGLDMSVGPVRPDAPKKLVQATDMRVQLASQGLTGVKFLQLDFFPVDDNPPPLLSFPVPENYIPATPSTMKSIEDSLVRVIQRMPEVVDQMAVILMRVDSILVDVQDKEVPERLITTLDNANHVIAEAQQKIAALNTGKLSDEASKTLKSLGDAVNRMNSLLARVDGDKGLLASLTRASDAMGDTARGADGLGPQMEDTLTAVEKAARSIQKLATALEKDPDMLVKGRSHTPEPSR